MRCLGKYQTTWKMLRTKCDQLSSENAQVVVENWSKLQKWRFGSENVQQWSKQVQNTKSDLEKWIWEPIGVKCKIWPFKVQMTTKLNSKPWNCAIKPIKHGEMLTSSYLTNELMRQPTENRRRYLLETKCFLCSCTRCTSQGIVAKIFAIFFY